MDAEVGKLTENLQIKEKAPKNWCDLPVEMKAEVVKYVDFKSSLRLRQTAHLERLLVDSKKFDFSTVRIYTGIEGCESLQIWRPEDGVIDPFFCCHELPGSQNLAPFVAHILKIGQIDKLIIFSCANFIEVNKIDSIRVKKLITGPWLPPIDPIALLLSKCPEMLDSVNIRHHCDNDDFPLRAVGDLAKISNTKLLEYDYQVGFLKRSHFSEIVTTFANRQNVVGTMVKFLIDPDETILNSSPTQVRNGDRIPTSDPSIEILFEVSDVDSDEMHDVTMHFVPSEPKINNSEI